MPFNSVGVATRAGSPVVNGAISDASDVNTPVADIIAMLNLVSLRDGRAAMTGNLNMAGFRIQGLPNASVSDDAAAFGQIQAAVNAFADDFAGMVGFFARNSAPTGWLKANGAAVSRATYATLFARIGVLFGNGDGSTTFNLPDLRGEFPRGWDDGRNIDVGRSFGTSQLDAVQNWNAQFDIRQFSVGATPANLIPAFSGAASVGAPSGNTTNISVTSAAQQGGQSVTIGPSQNGQARTATETRGRNVALLACIKF